MIEPCCRKTWVWMTNWQLWPPRTSLSWQRPAIVTPVLVPKLAWPIPQPIRVRLASAREGSASTSAPWIGSQTLQPIVEAARARWQQAGIADLDAALLNTVQFQRADLPGSSLTQTLGTTVTLDGNAADHGWFIDPTPMNDEEFQAAGGEMIAIPGGQVGNRYDLLSVVMREMGRFIARGRGFPRRGGRARGEKCKARSRRAGTTCGTGGQRSARTVGCDTRRSSARRFAPVSVQDHTERFCPLPSLLGTHALAGLTKNLSCDVPVWHEPLKPSLFGGNSRFVG
jgi:hypothetical protein